MKKFTVNFVLLVSWILLASCDTTGTGISNVELEEIKKDISSLQNRIDDLEKIKCDNYEDELESINDELSIIKTSLGEFLFDSDQTDSIYLSNKINTLEESITSLNDKIETYVTQEELDEIVSEYKSQISQLESLIELMVAYDQQEYILTSTEINMYLSEINQKINNFSYVSLSDYNFDSTYTNSCISEDYDICYKSGNYPSVYTENFETAIGKIDDLDIISFYTNIAWENIGGFDDFPMIVGQEMGNSDTLFSLEGRNSTSALFSLDVSGETSSVSGTFSVKMLIYKNPITNKVSIEFMYNIEASYSILSLDFKTFNLLVNFDENSNIENIVISKTYVWGITENVAVYELTDNGLDVYYMIDNLGSFLKEYYHFGSRNLIYIGYEDATVSSPVFTYESYNYDGLLWKYEHKEDQGDVHYVPLNRFLNWDTIEYSNGLISPLMFSINFSTGTNVTLSEDEASNKLINKTDFYTFSIDEESNYQIIKLPDMLVFTGDAQGDIMSNSYYYDLELDNDVINDMDCLIDSSFESPEFFNIYEFNGYNVFSDVNLHIEQFDLKLNNE